MPMNSTSNLLVLVPFLHSQIMEDLRSNFPGNQRQSSRRVLVLLHASAFETLDIAETNRQSFNETKWCRLTENERFLNCISTIIYLNAWKVNHPSLIEVSNFGHLQLQDWAWAPCLLCRIFPQLICDKKKKARVSSLIATCIFCAVSFCF